MDLVWGKDHEEIYLRDCCIVDAVRDSGNGSKRDTVGRIRERNRSESVLGTASGHVSC